MRYAWVLLLASCSFHTNGQTSDAAAHDAPGDTSMMATGDAHDCWGTGIVQICPAVAPSGSLTLTGTLDTDSAPACKAYAVPSTSKALDACVIPAQTIMVTGTLSVTGSRPLVLLATDTITVATGATLDVSSARSPSRTGAGGNAAACNPSNGGNSGIGGSGGGAGGSFGDTGGAGGDGDSGASAGTPGAKASTIDVLRGGCGGGPGGGLAGGSAGAGGGAVALIAGTSILVSGTINGSGAAGDAASSLSDGGGAGGSGGMLVLDAPTLFGGGTLLANGGGGGEGACAIPGNPGAEPDPASPLTAAPGGHGLNDAGNGGDGAAGSTTTGGQASNGKNTCGGGGGGGGAGYILLYASTNTLTGARSP